MSIIHPLKTPARLVEPALAERLRVMPQVVVADAIHLRTFRKEYAKTARAGLLLHTGNAMEWLAPDVLAVPLWRIL